MVSPIPHDADTERAVVACALWSREALDETSEIINADDFLDPNLGHIWHAIVTMRDRGEQIDWLTVSAAAEVVVPGARELLAAMYDAAPMVSHGARYASRVAELAAARRLIAAAAQMTADANELPIDEALDRARMHLERLDVPNVTGPPSRTFAALDAAPYDWLIPGLLERGDRLLITAGEGAGKTTLLRQIAVQVASGIAPFTNREIEPKRVLVVDFENGERSLGRKLRWLASFSKTLDADLLRVECRQSGIDVTSRNDRAWLLDRIRANEPDLLVIGPIYKMIPEADGRRDGAGGESSAIRLTRVLDQVRDMGVTLIIETHAPHGNGFGRDMRPFGSSVWLRWPEFGFGLRKDEDEKDKFIWQAFRGPRDDNRDWPEALWRGQQGHWPWTATFGGPARRRAS